MELDNGFAAAGLSRDANQSYRVSRTRRAGMVVDSAAG